ncbi:hypothetical protein P7C70_g1607, partial [Phenoliferia sp. Uapishka_3]
MQFGITGGTAPYTLSIINPLGTALTGVNAANLTNVTSSYTEVTNTVTGGSVYSVFLTDSTGSYSKVSSFTSGLGVSGCEAVTTSLVSSTLSTAISSSSNAAATGGSHHSSSNTGAIAGGVVGGVVVLALILAAILFFLRKRKPSSKEQAMETITAGGATQPPPSFHNTNQLASGAGAGLGAGAATYGSSPYAPVPSPATTDPSQHYSPPYDQQTFSQDPDAYYGREHQPPTSTLSPPPPMAYQGSPSLSPSPYENNPVTYQAFSPSGATSGSTMVTGWAPGQGEGYEHGGFAPPNMLDQMGRLPTPGASGPPTPAPSWQPSGYAAYTNDDLERPESFAPRH